MGFYKHFILTCALLSTVSCLLVIVGIASDPLKDKSVNTKLILRLLFSDLMICLSYGVYYAIESSVGLGDEPLASVCNAYLPVPIFFFLASWGWTALLAYRFSVKPIMSKERRKQGGIKALPVPMYAVWLASFVIVLPVIIANIASRHGVGAVEPSQQASRTCVFDYSQKLGQALDITCVIVPLVLTLLYNIYCYTVGLMAVSNAPHCVIARQMRRAQGYVLVLIGIWLPNACFSILRISEPDKSNHLLLNFAITLTTLQGLFNVLVYVYTNKHTRNVVREAMWGARNDDMSAASQSMGGSSGPWYSSQTDADLNEAAKGGAGGILRPSTSRILINNRALMAAKAEEAEYNFQQNRLKQQQAEALARQQEEGGSPVPSGSTSGSIPSGSISIGASSDTYRDSQRSRTGSSGGAGYGSRASRVSSSSYSAQLQSASPIARFVSPLWAQYDSDEEETVAEEEAEEEARAAREVETARLSKGVDNPMQAMPATYSPPPAPSAPTNPPSMPLPVPASGAGGAGEQRGRLDSAEIARQRKARRKESYEAAVDAQDDDSDYDDDSSDRDSEKYVRFGKDAVRFISTGSAGGLSHTSGNSLGDPDPNSVELSRSLSGSRDGKGAGPGISGGGRR